MKTKPEKVTISKVIQRPVSAAHYKDVDTGETNEVTIRDADGKNRVEQRPIKQRVFVPAKYEEQEIKQDMWVVKTKAVAKMGRKIITTDGVLVDELEETHEFATKEDAEEYYRSRK